MNAAGTAGDSEDSQCHTANSGSVPVRPGHCGALLHVSSLGAQKLYKEHSFPEKPTQKIIQANRGDKIKIHKYGRAGKKRRTGAWR